MCGGGDRGNGYTDTQGAGETWTCDSQGSGCHVHFRDSPTGSCCSAPAAAIRSSNCEGSATRLPDMSAHPNVCCAATLASVAAFPGDGTTASAAATEQRHPHSHVPLKPTYKTFSLPSHKIIIAGASSGGNRVAVNKGTTKTPVDLLGSIMASMDKPAGSGNPSPSPSASSTSSATTNSSLSSYASSSSNNSY